MFEFVVAFQGTLEGTQSFLVVEYLKAGFRKVSNLTYPTYTVSCQDGIKLQVNTNGVIGVVSQSGYVLIKLTEEANLLQVSLALA